jgi:hypothetical protein
MLGTSGDVAKLRGIQQLGFAGNGHGKLPADNERYLCMRVLVQGYFVARSHRNPVDGLPFGMYELAEKSGGYFFGVDIVEWMKMLRHGVASLKVHEFTSSQVVGITQIVSHLHIFKLAN